MSFTLAEVEEKVKLIIEDKLGVHESEIKIDSQWKSLGADSLDTVELIMEFEKEFNIKIEDAEAEKIGTVEDAVNLVYKKSKN